MKRLLLISFVLAAFCFQGCKCEKDYTDKIPKEFDAYCQKTLDEWQLPGMAVVVVKGREDRVPQRLWRV